MAACWCLGGDGRWLGEIMVQDCHFDQWEGGFRRTLEESPMILGLNSLN